jgi:hypothetical protein
MVRLREGKKKREKSLVRRIVPSYGMLENVGGM